MTYMILPNPDVNFCAKSLKNEDENFFSFKIKCFPWKFPWKLHEQDSPLSHMLVYHSAAGEEVVIMRVVVVKFPKALCGLLRRIFGMS